MPVPDYDDLLVGRYIRAIENPDSIGFQGGKWPPHKKDMTSIIEGLVLM